MRNVQDQGHEDAATPTRAGVGQHTSSHFSGWRMVPTVSQSFDEGQNGISCGGLV